MADESDEAFNRLMDAVQTLIQLTPGDVLTQEMIDDLHLVDADHRESFERATDAFSRGYEAGLQRGAGADVAKLIEERDEARDDAAIQRALLKALTASAIETRQGGDAKQAPSRSDESAAREAGDAQ
jgi:hypothetical protein